MMNSLLYFSPTDPAISFFSLIFVFFSIFSYWSGDIIFLGSFFTDYNFLCSLGPRFWSVHPLLYNLHIFGLENSSCSNFGTDWIEGGAKNT